MIALAFIAVLLTADPETRITVPADGVLPVEIGRKYVLRVPGIQRIAPGCRDSIDFSTIGNDEVLIQAFAECPGGTQLIWKSNGERISLLTYSFTAPLFDKVEDGSSLTVEIGKPATLYIRGGVKRFVSACANAQTLKILGHDFIEVRATAECTGDLQVFKANGRGLTVHITSVTGRPAVPPTTEAKDGGG
jgi:hypothetical protein